MINANMNYIGLGASVQQTKIILGSATDMNAQGNSITAGNGASDPAHRWTNIVATTKGLNLFNGGVGGQGVWQLTKDLQGGELNASTMRTVMIGINDLYRCAIAEGDLSKAVLKIEAANKAIIHRNLLGNNEILAGASGDTGVTRVGTITAYNASAKGGLMGTGTLPGFYGTSSSTIGDNWSYSFTGDKVSIQFIGSDGVAEVMGEADIFIDDVLVDHINLNNWTDGVSDGSDANQYCPVVVMVSGLTNAAHVVKIQVTTAHRVVVDFISSFRNVAGNPPLIIGQVPFSSQGVYSDSYVIDVNLRLKNMVNFYIGLGFNIALARVNDFYNRINSDDQLHPNDTGHAQVAQAFLAAFA